MTARDLLRLPPVERPSENRYWREKVRQTLQVYPEFQRAGAGTWQVAA